MSDVETMTYSLAEAAAKIPCSERWLIDGLRAGRFRGRKIMGRWRLTDEDLRQIIHDCRVTAPTETDTPAFDFVTRGRAKPP